MLRLDELRGGQVKFTAALRNQKFRLNSNDISDPSANGQTAFAASY